MLCQDCEKVIKRRKKKNKPIQIVDRSKLKSFKKYFNAVRIELISAATLIQTRIDWNDDADAADELIETTRNEMDQKCEEKSKSTKKSIDSKPKQNRRRAKKKTHNFFSFFFSYFCNSTSYAALDYDKWISALMNFSLCFFFFFVVFMAVLYVERQNLKINCIHFVNRLLQRRFEVSLSSFYSHFFFSICCCCWCFSTVRPLYKTAQWFLCSHSMCVCVCKYMCRFALFLRKKKFYS